MQNDAEQRPLLRLGRAAKATALAYACRGRAGSAAADSRITHPNLVCQDACAVFVTALAYAVASGSSAAEVYRFARSWAQTNIRETAVADAIAAAAHDAPADFMANAGWVLVALQNAFYRLLHADTLEQGIVDTVASGGDTDTNAAIAGALLGAVHGRDAIPLRWRNVGDALRLLDRPHHDREWLRRSALALT